MPNTSKPGSFKNLSKQIGWAAQNSPGTAMGAMMGFMGMPFMQRRGGQMMTIDPRNQSIYAAGTTPPVAPPPAAADGSGNNPGGDDPANPGFPGNAYPKNVIPQWWIDWYNASGQYGGVPPVQGLL